MGGRYAATELVEASATNVMAIPGTVLCLSGHVDGPTVYRTISRYRKAGTERSGMGEIAPPRNSLRSAGDLKTRWVNSSAIGEDPAIRFGKSYRDRDGSSRHRTLRMQPGPEGLREGE